MSAAEPARMAGTYGSQSSSKQPASDNEIVASFFDAIARADVAAVRSMLGAHRSELVGVKHRLGTGFSYPRDAEVAAFKFLGSYIGSMTGLQYSILLSHESIALEIIDSTFGDDIDLEFGQGNTALHLAALLGENVVVRGLLERGAKASAKNRKGFTPLDLVDDLEMKRTFAEAGAAVVNSPTRSKAEPTITENDMYRLSRAEEEEEENEDEEDDDEEGDDGGEGAE